VIVLKRLCAIPLMALIGPLGLIDVLMWIFGSEKRGPGDRLVGFILRWTKREAS
jgi:hypothetical protein